MRFVKKIASPFAAVLGVAFCVVVVIVLIGVHVAVGGEQADKVSDWAGGVIDRASAWLDS